MRIKLSFYLLLGVFAVQAHAGQDRGGGNAVVCFSDQSIPKNIARENNRPILDSELSKITSIELLDVYQERLKTDIEGNVNRLLEPKASETPREFANRLIHRIEHVSVNYYDELSDTMEDLFDRDLIHMAP